MNWLMRVWCVRRTSAFSKLRARSAAERWLLIEAVLWLAVARAAIVAIPFRWITWLFALKSGIAGATTELETQGVASGIGWAVRTASTRTPWQSMCLAQSLAGSAMLRRRRIPADLTLGVARIGADCTFTAHAWLTSGGVILTGAAGH